MKSNILEIDELQVEVSWKNIKNINIRIKPPRGDVFVSAPVGVSSEKIADIIRSKSDWINEKQSLLRRDFEVVTPLNNTDNEIVFQGKKYPVEEVYTAGKNRIILYDENKILLRSNGSLSPAGRSELIGAWYRSQMRVQITELLKEWVPVIGVDLAEWRIRRMKTRWGSCNTVQRRIWLNLELAKLPPECLEYVVVHELVHLLERGHNARFWGLVESFLPDWRESRDKLRCWEICM